MISVTCSELLKCTDVKLKGTGWHLDWLCTKRFMWPPKRKLLKLSMMPNWPISAAPKLQTAQTANSFFMSLINSWEEINHHFFLPQFLLLSPWAIFYLFPWQSSYYQESTRLWNITSTCFTLQPWYQIPTDSIHLLSANNYWLFTLTHYQVCT